MLPQEVIRHKRDGGALSIDEIEFVVRGITSGDLAESQIGAFAMAVLLRGMDVTETVALTRAMTASGSQLTWPNLPGPVLDKHSTGGIGDTVSLMLAPAVAACGGFVPMISGRGLGHTGGTLDKLESIPGYDTRPDSDRFHRVVRDVGCAIIGQTADLAPADRRLYAIRDVTSTVESIPLITASILSKKLAAGVHGLVMNVTWGSGAFMAEFADARRLADSLVTVAEGAGLPTTALLTDMNQPLGSAAGNAVEVRYAVDYLTGVRREPRMDEVVLSLGAELLVLGGLASDVSAGRLQIDRALASGAATDRFDRMITALGGPADFCSTSARHLPSLAPVSSVVPARAGVVTAIDTRAIGLAVVALGGGRLREDQSIDPAVGLTALASIGEAVGPDHPLALVHARDDAAFDAAAARVRSAYTVGDEAPVATVVVTDRIRRRG